MKVKQVVEITAAAVYVGWSRFDISDANGNEVQITMNDEQLERLSKDLESRVARNRADKLTELREKLDAEKNADSN